MIRGITTKPGGLLKLSHRTAHTISTPMLVNLDRRWEKMSSEEQVDIQAQLAKRQEGPWTELTLEEKKASYFVAFGPHGPRTNAHPPGFNRKVFAGTLAGIGATAVLFYGLRMLAKPPPKTMTKEYQEATNERLREQNVEPISGVSSDGYDGPGMVQSK